MGAPVGTAVVPRTSWMPAPLHGAWSTRDGPGTCSSVGHPLCLGTTSAFTTFALLPLGLLFDPGRGGLGAEGSLAGEVPAIPVGGDSRDLGLSTEPRRRVPTRCSAPASTPRSPTKYSR